MVKKEYFFVVIAAFIFSSMGLFVRFVSVSGFFVYFFAALISSILFFFLLLKEGKIREIFSKKELVTLIILSIFNILNNITYFYSYQLTTIANATFTHYLAPILVVVLAPYILSEKTERKTWIAVFLALIGLFMLLLPSQTNNTNLLGIFLGCLSAVGYAFGIMYVRKASLFFEPKQILFCIMFFSVLFLTPFVLFLKPTLLLSDLAPLFILGVFHQGFAGLLLFRALKQIPAQKVSILMYLEPFGAVILAVIFLKEIPNIVTLLGGFLIILACYVTIHNSKTKV